jgi:hypothetical protein
MYQISVRTYVCISGHGSVVIERWIDVLDVRIRPCMSKKSRLPVSAQLGSEHFVVVLFRG